MCQRTCQIRVGFSHMWPVSGKIPTAFGGVRPRQRPELVQFRPKLPEVEKTRRFRPALTRLPPWRSCCVLASRCCARRAALVSQRARSPASPPPLLKRCFPFAAGGAVPRALGPSRRGSRSGSNTAGDGQEALLASGQATARKPSGGRFRGPSGLLRPVTGQPPSRPRRTTAEPRKCAEGVPR